LAQNLLCVCGVNRFLSLIVLMSFVAVIVPRPAFAAKKLAIAVVAAKHGGAASQEMSSSLRRALSQDSRFHLIDGQLVGQVANYHRGTHTATPSQFRAATDFLARAQHHYFTMNYEEARAEVSRAVALLKQDRASLDAKGQFFFDSLMTSALIARALDDDVAMADALVDAARLNSAHDLDRRTYPPSIVKSFNEAREKVARSGTGAIKVTTRPGVAEVYLNGIMSGVTPLEIEDLPAGEYDLMIRTNKYRPMAKRVSVKAGATMRISERLDWTGNSNAAATDGLGEIDEALHVATLMKADRAVLISASATTDGGGVARARLVDSNYKAAYRPIVVHYGINDRAESLAQFADEISGMLKRDLATDPASLSDPGGTADPILLGKGKKRIIGSPILWGAVGAAVVGGVVGGVLMATGGGSSKTGNLRVNFQ
jgi:hypothetical protein